MHAHVCPIAAHLMCIYDVWVCCQIVFVVVCAIVCSNVCLCVHWRLPPAFDNMASDTVVEQCNMAQSIAQRSSATNCEENEFNNIIDIFTTGIEWVSDSRGLRFDVLFHLGMTFKQFNWPPLLLLIPSRRQCVLELLRLLVSCGRLTPQMFPNLGGRRPTMMTRTMRSRTTTRCARWPRQQRQS